MTIKPFAVRSQAGIEDAVIAVARGTAEFDVPADAAWASEARTRIDAARAMLGAFEKKLQPCEKDNVYWMRRSITAAKDLPAGHKVTAADLLWMRPMAGLVAGDEAQVIGRTLDAPMKHGDAFQARG